MLPEGLCLGPDTRTARASSESHAANRLHPGGCWKGGRLGPQKSRQLVIHGLLSGPLVYESIGQCFQDEGLVVNYLGWISEGWRWWQWHFSLILSSVLTHFLFILGRVLSIRLHSRASNCRVLNAGGPRNASGSHL